VMQDFTVRMKQMIQRIPAGDFLNPDDTCWLLNA
jgi:hypothetical protein